MGEPFYLMCSMSPKATQKNKRTVKSKVPSKLALPKSIRKSFIYDKFEARSTNVPDLKTDSESTEIFEDDPDIIVISDSDDSKNISEPKKNICADVLDKLAVPSTLMTKENDIKKWLLNVENCEKNYNPDINLSVFSRISAIEGHKKVDEFGVAANSTFLHDGNNPRFDELFKRLSTRLETNNVQHINNLETGTNRRELNLCSSEAKLNNFDDTSTANLLDKLYGDTWRRKQNEILPLSEPRVRKAKKPNIRVPQTERRPEYSKYRTNLHSHRENTSVNSTDFQANDILNMPKDFINSRKLNLYAVREKINFDAHGLSTYSEEDSSDKNFPETKLYKSSSEENINPILGKNKLINNLNIHTFSDHTETNRNDNLEQEFHTLCLNEDHNGKHLNKNNIPKQSDKQERLKTRKKYVRLKHFSTSSDSDNSKSGTLDEITNVYKTPKSKTEYSATRIDDSFNGCKNSKPRTASINKKLDTLSNVYKTPKHKTGDTIKESDDVPSNVYKTPKPKSGDINKEIDDVASNVFKTPKPKTGYSEEIIKDMSNVDKTRNTAKKINNISKADVITAKSKSGEDKKKIDDAPNIIYKTPKSRIENFRVIETKAVTERKCKSKAFFNDDSDSLSSEESYKIIRKLDASKKATVDECQSFLASLSKSVADKYSDPAALIFRTSYKQYRDDLLRRLFDLYNERVFQSAIPKDSPIEWSDRMTGTAGRCICKKITRSSGIIERKIRIVLASKVLDSADRLRDTLIHELCHAATWIVNETCSGHGSFWKAWTYKAMKEFPELPPIKRCHDYVVNSKYTYRCTRCEYSFGRHTKSVDIEKKRCGHCMGKFEILINKITKNGISKSLPATPKKQPTPFALFVKENYGNVRRQGEKHQDVMKILGQKFQELKITKHPESGNV